MLSGEVVTAVIDKDGTASNLREDIFNPRVRAGLSHLLTERAGLVVFATGRIANLDKLDPEGWAYLSRANALNPNGIHVYEGGARVADTQGRIINHEAHRLEPGQIEAVVALSTKLLAAKSQVVLAFQGADYDTKTGNWLQTQPEAWVSNPAQQITERKALYDHFYDEPIAQMPAVLERLNLSRIVCVVTAGGDEIDLHIVQDYLGPFGLAVYGNSREFDVARGEVNKATGARIAADALSISQFDICAGDGIAAKHGNDWPLLLDKSLVNFGLIVLNGNKLPPGLEPAMYYDTVANPDELGDFLKEI